ncbi:hypothetical protein ACERNI_04615 [Camelimonas sp. ID_303_24]
MGSNSGKSRRGRGRKHVASVVLGAVLVTPENVSAAIPKTTASISKVIAPQAAADGGLFLLWGRAGADGATTAQDLQIGLDGSPEAPVHIVSDGHGVEARNLGQAGGRGGNGAHGMFTASGGDGGAGGKGGAVTVTTTGRGSITVNGDGHHGIVAVSAGGNGGDGGDIFSLGLGLNKAGNGGAGGAAGDVAVNNEFDITTTGANSAGIWAESAGGDGGAGGKASGFSVASFGGAGAGATDGGAVTVRHAGRITTSGDNAYGILARSRGGRAGDGGGASSFVPTGGRGADASRGSSVVVHTQKGSSISTSGAGASAILAQSASGKAGSGGSAGGVIPSGGGGADGSATGSVIVNNAATLTTTGAGAGGLVAQSIGGGGGSGGAAGGLIFPRGGAGGDGGQGGKVWVTNAGDITTGGDDSGGVTAQSIGGGGGAGGAAISVNLLGAIAMGGQGGNGGSAGAVCINGDATCSAPAGAAIAAIRTSGDRSAGVTAQSIGGGGGAGGFAIAAAAGVKLPAIAVALGANGGVGGAGGDIFVGSQGTIFTSGAFSTGVDASSIGGGGGRGGFSVAAAAATDLGAIAVSLGGKGGAGGRAGAVTMNTRLDIVTRGDHAAGISAASIGGGGGNAGFSVDAALAAGPAVALSFGAAGGAGDTSGAVQVRNTGSIRTGVVEAGAGAGSTGILAQSVGGGGGNGGFSVAAGASTLAGAQLSLGGAGATGAAGGDVSVTSNDAAHMDNMIATAGPNAAGILAQSVGGGGGNGAFSGTGGFGSNAALSVSLGGAGGSGGDAGKTAVSSFGRIVTRGDASGAILAQSVGGGGGNGAFTITATGGETAVTLNLGGAGGAGGLGGAVSVSSDGVLVTRGARAHGVMAQSIGGGGGAGGLTGSGSGGEYRAISLNLGGKGGAGGASSDVTISTSGAISTEGAQSAGILAQSIGGGGGSGGVAVNVTGAGQNAMTYNVGGSGVSGGRGGRVAVNNTANISTQGALSWGVAAQSIGGGGGDGGLSLAGALSPSGKGMAKVTGGDGVTDSSGGVVTLTHEGTIQTAGDGAAGVLAQSIGGGGGAGGFAAALAFGRDGDGTANATGGKGGAGSSGEAVTVSTRGAVNTRGANASGVMAQSIGGGGGAGAMAIAAGFSSSAKGASNATGGIGGSGGHGGNVSVDNAATIATLGQASHGIMAQSIGGGGGAGGLAIAGTLSLGDDAASNATGGAGGQGQRGGAVDVANAGNVNVAGAGAAAIMAQSIGGGGGAGGFAGALAVSSAKKGVTDTTGGQGGAGNDGGAVTLTSTGELLARGDNGGGVIAQSIGGGGGVGGFAIGGGLAFAAESAAATTGGAGGSGGQGGVVTLNLPGGSIETHGALAHGAMAQSIGGGGGKGGFVINASVALDGAANASAGAGAGGASGDGGAANLINTARIVTTGDGSMGVLAQSIGGAGGAGGFVISGAFSSASHDAPADGPQDAHADGRSGADHGGKAAASEQNGEAKQDAATARVGGAGGGGGQGGAVLARNGGHILTRGKAATGLMAQSIGGGGGQGGFVIAGAGNLAGDAHGVVGGAGSSGGNAGAVRVVQDADGQIETHGDMARGLVAQSIGGGGGDGGFALGAAFNTSGDVRNEVGGGAAGRGGHGDAVNVANAGAIITSGNHATALLAQSVGAGGGSGGFASGLSIAAGKSLSQITGGASGAGGGGGVVDVENSGAITTAGAASAGVIAQSIGGGGGQGGLTVAGAISAGEGAANSVGGTGGAGGDAAAVTVRNSGRIVTSGDIAWGLMAQSIGGGGGSGGVAVAGGLSTGDKGETSTTGGSGAVGGSGGDVALHLGGTVRTAGKGAAGVMAQSIGGGGGVASFTGGLSLGSNGLLTGATGGKGGAGGNGGGVSLSGDGNVTTSGDNAPAMIAQSIGGGGGVNSHTLDLKSLMSGGVLLAGGEGVSSGAGGKVTAEPGNGALDTSGALAHGLVAQSIGGGGGVTALTASQTLEAQELYLVAGGGEGSDGRTAAGSQDGGTVDLRSANRIRTTGAGAMGVIAQSIGGGGGVIGMTHAGSDMTLAIARLGADGVRGAGGAVSIVQGGAIATDGFAATGLLAQSIGGGGGLLVATGATSMAGWRIGATGNGGGDGGAVSVNNAATIATLGDRAAGLIAQSIGGGGGLHLSRDVASLKPVAATGAQLAGNGGAVSIANAGAISAAGNRSDGIVAQSAGGGGGLAAGFAGSVGGAGSGGDVIVRNSGAIAVTGADATGIFAQSAGGTGAAAVDVTTSADVRATGAGGVAIRAISQGGAGVDGDVAVTIDRGTVEGGAGGRAIEIATRGVGKLVNAGHLLTRDGAAGVAISIDASDLKFANHGTITGSIDLKGGAVLLENAASGVLRSGRSIAMPAGSTLVNQGEIMPGGPGQLMTTDLIADLEQMQGGLIAAKLSPGDAAADRINVKGQAHLQGAIRLLPFDPGAARPGTFETPPVLHVEGNSDATDLTLEPIPSAVAAFRMTRPATGDMAIAYDVDFLPGGLALNQQAIGATVNRIQAEANRSPFSPVTAGLFVIPTLSRLASAYGALSGESLTASQSAAFTTMSGFGEQVLAAAQNSAGGGNPVTDAGQAAHGVRAGGRIWASAGGGGARQAGDRVHGGSASQRNFHSALSAGVDCQFGNGGLLGVAVNSAQGGFSVRERGGSASSQHIQGAIYGRVARGDAWLAATASAGAHQFQSQRTLAGIGPTERAQARFNAESLNLRTEAGYNFGTEALRVSPFVGVDYKLLHVDAFRERATLLDGQPGPMALAVRSQWSRSMESLAGLQFSASLPMGGNGVLTPWLRATWAHEFSPRRNLAAAFRSAPGFGFGAIGAAAAKDQARIEMGVTAQFGDALSLNLRGGATLSHRLASWQGALALQYRW